MTGLCYSECRDSGGRPRVCVLERDHTGAHEDARGDRWERPETVLERLRETWGATHRIAWTGALWIAVHRDPTAPWRTEIEPTPEQLEERLQTRQAAPVPIQRSHP